MTKQNRHKQDNKNLLTQATMYSALAESTQNSKLRRLAARQLAKLALKIKDTAAKQK